MKFNITSLTRQEFQIFEDVTSAVAEACGYVPKSELTLITHNVEDVSELSTREFIHTYGPVLDGLAFQAKSKPKEYGIYLSPNLSGSLPLYICLHEICHGIVGIGKDHDKKWRMLYTQVLLHFNQEVSTLPNVIDTCKTLLNRYCENKTLAYKELPEVMDRYDDMQGKVREILDAKS